MSICVPSYNAVFLPSSDNISTNCIYEAFAKSPSTRPSLISIPVNSKPEWKNCSNWIRFVSKRLSASRVIWRLTTACMFHKAHQRVWPNHAGPIGDWVSTYISTLWCSKMAMRHHIRFVAVLEKKVDSSWHVPCAFIQQRSYHMPLVKIDAWQRHRKASFETSSTPYGPIIGRSLPKNHWLNLFGTGWSISNQFSSSMHSSSSTFSKWLYVLSTTSNPDASAKGWSFYLTYSLLWCGCLLRRYISAIATL